MRGIARLHASRVPSHFRANPHVYRVIRTIGKYDIICDLRVEDDAQLREFTRQIRDKFADVIVSMDAFGVYDIYRYNFFPADARK